MFIFCFFFFLSGLLWFTIRLYGLGTRWYGGRSSLPRILKSYPKHRLNKLCMENGNGLHRQYLRTLYYPLSNGQSSWLLDYPRCKPSEFGDSQRHHIQFNNQRHGCSIKAFKVWPASSKDLVEVIWKKYLFVPETPSLFS